MDNLFIKEVVKGKLIEIERFTVSKMLQVTLKNKNKKVEEHELLVQFVCSVLKIDGQSVKPEELLDSTDFELFNFISESFNAMTNNNLL